MSSSQHYILAIDSSTPCSTVAVTTGTRQNGKVLGCIALSSKVTHSRRLLTSIDRLLEETNINKQEIAGYAVGLGPGSFTGLRIGMATAKGLAAAAEKPLYGVLTPDILAATCIGAENICVVLDARKKEVYAAMYHQDEAGYPVRVGDIQAISPQELVQHLSDPVVMVGDGLHSYQELWRTELGLKMIVAPANLWSPSAAILGLLAGELALEGGELPLADAVPLYVRASDAELNLKKQQERATHR